MDIDEVYHFYLDQEANSHIGYLHHYHILHTELFVIWSSFRTCLKYGRTLQNSMNAMSVPMVAEQHRQVYHPFVHEQETIPTYLSSTRTTHWYERYQIVLK